MLLPLEMEEMKVKWFRGGARDPGSEKGRKAEFRQLGEEKRALGMQKVIGPLTWGHRQGVVET